MVEITNIFEEGEENFWYRWSTLLIFTFIYYQVGYYLLLNKTAKCRNLPSLQVLIFIIVFHLLQVFAIFKLYQDEKFIAIWCVIIIPLIAYMMYCNYSKRIKEEQERKLQYMLYKLQSKKASNLFDQDTTTTGMQNQMIRDQNTNDLLHIKPQNLNHQEMKDIINSQNGVGYGDYISQYDAKNSAETILNTLDPYNKQFSALSPF